MITLIVTHSSENSLTSQLVNVQSSSSAEWCGVYGNLEKEDEDGRLQALVDFLGIEYDNSLDNLAVSELPDKGAIKTLKL